VFVLISVFPINAFVVDKKPSTRCRLTKFDKNANYFIEFRRQVSYLFTQLLGRKS